MKVLINKGLLIIVLCGLFLFAGCSSMKSISYSLAEDEIKSASLSFLTGSPGVTFVSYKDNRLPEAEEGTQWDPILLPSDVPLEITVHAYYYQSGGAGYSGGLLAGLISDAITSGLRKSRSVDNDIIFLCPPLNAGKEYRLSFNKGIGIPGDNTLILTEIAAKTVVYQQIFVID